MTAQQGADPVISAFCELVGSLIREYDSLRDQGNLTVIGSTTRFASQLFVPENDAEIQILADTSLHITSEQATALLRAVAAIDHGRHFIRSVLFIIYINPTVQSGDEFSDEMRRIYDIVTSDAEEIVTTASDKVDIDALPAEVTQGLDETSYYWLLNFFMADGETIARTLLDRSDPVIELREVEAYFNDNQDRAEEFHDFLTRQRQTLALRRATLTYKPTALQYQYRLMSDFDAERTDTLELAADEFENLGEVLRHTDEQNDAVYAETIRIHTANQSYLITANDGQVLLREESTTEE